MSNEHDTTGSARHRADMQERAAFDSCPFCGGVGQPHQLTEPSEFVVVCGDCGASSPIVVAIMDDPLPALEQAWNRREVRITGGGWAALLERQAQFRREGFTSTGDDLMTDAQLAKAAVCYVLWGAGSTGGGEDGVPNHPTLPGPPGWPWSKAWWKPRHRRGDLVKAAALIIAEIDRLDRMRGEPF